MGFLSISKTLLILIVPFLIFLGSASQIAFDKNFYAEKFSEYGINVPEAEAINDATVDFVSGKKNEPPGLYNEREKQHLQDVRDLAKAGRAMFYFFAVLFSSLLLASFLALKAGNPANFLGGIIAYGGALTMGIAALLLAMAGLNFAPAFESFHKIFFERGTYTFDPQNEAIVNLYPEKLFMDLGLGILKWVLFASAVITIIGMFLIKKNKKN